jgi:alkylation response protein AidB-like acyl-CoA dehydrogenase
MMDFGLSEAQEALQSSARAFLAAECPPELVRETARSEDGVPRGLYRQLAELGWFSLLVPERDGGLGLGVLDLALVLEEMGRVAAPGPFLSTQLVIAAVLKGASARQRRRWLPRLTSGNGFAAVAALEDDGRLDATGIQTRARRSRGGYQLNGTKAFVLDAPAADMLLVAARTKSGRNGAGVTLFMVERSAPGVRVQPNQTLDLTRRHGTIELRDVAVPAEARLGKEGEGGPLLERLLDLGAVGLAADALGGAARTLEMAVDYAKVRQQFGRLIGSFQAIKHLAAEMVADVEPARSLVWYAAWAQDERPRERRRLASMAKASLSEIYSRTARRSVEIHGGIGFTWEFDLHLWFKRAHLGEVLFGDPTLHRERIAMLDGY